MIRGSSPKISVILPVYNAAEFLGDAINSILKQTCTDFELIIINDCSTDNSGEILSSYTDARVVLYHNETNMKVVKTLNKGLELARGEYIARMDADDVSHPKRFEKQAAFLDANPGVDICGTWVQTFGGGQEVIRAAVEHEHIKVRLFFLNPIFHPAVMFRKESLKKHDLSYDPNFINAEDYGLWVKAIDVLKFANLPEVLLKYRIHDANVSVYKQSNKDVLDQIHYNIYAFFLNRLKIDFSEKDLLMQRRLGMVNTGRLTLDELNEYVLWLKKLTVANNVAGYFDAIFFRRVILSYLVYLSKQTGQPVQAAKLIYKVMGSHYKLNDCTGYIVSRTKVKLHPITKF